MLRKNNFMLVVNVFDDMKSIQHSSKKISVHNALNCSNCSTQTLHFFVKGDDSSVEELDTEKWHVFHPGYFNGYRIAAEKHISTNDRLNEPDPAKLDERNSQYLKYRHTDEIVLIGSLDSSCITCFLEDIKNTILDTAINLS